ncbi:MAG TPA: kelch repeat-containing protein [Methylomirabilota bacterium]|jgi:N-acetylneuraminic acid mutarotase|nr:kelch repeat-containing protein [Methylomirabilota bacterium]
MIGWTRLGLTGLVALTAGCLGATTESSAPIDLSAPGSWRMLAPMPSARQEVAVAALDGRVYVIGGFGSGMSPVATVEAYDPATNEWETRAQLPEPTHHPAAVVADGRLFVVGGFTGGRVGWTASQTVYEYDPRRNTWITRAPMPSPRGALAVAAVGGRLHALGGAAEEVTNAHEVYDPAADRWTIGNPMPTARDHLAAVAWQGRVWALGGRRSFTGTQYANVEVYDPATDSWRTGPPLPTGRGGLAAAALGDRILVFGGEAPFRIFNATEMYEAAANRWIAKAPMPTARHGIGAAVVGGTVYVPGGGRQPGFAATRISEAYTP